MLHGREYLAMLFGDYLHHQPKACYWPSQLGQVECYDSPFLSFFFKRRVKRSK